MRTIGQRSDVLMAKSVMWKELTAADLRDKAQAGAIVLMPVGSMEQHGPHLPVGVDTYLSEGVCKAAAEAIAAESRSWWHPRCGAAWPSTTWPMAGPSRSTSPHTRPCSVPAQEPGATRLQARPDRQRPRRQHRRAGSLPARPRPRGAGRRAAHHHTLRAGAKGDRAHPRGPGRRAPCLRGRDVDADGHRTRHRAPRQAWRGARAPHWTPQPAGVARYVSFRDATASGVIGDARRASAQKGEKLVAVVRDAIVAIVRDPATWG